MKLNDIQLKQILADLYALDAGLKTKETELIAIIEKIVEYKPQVVFDDAFAARLRSEVLAEARVLGTKKISFIFNLNHMSNKFFYAATGAAIAIIIIVPAVLLLNRQTQLATTRDEITQSSKNAKPTVFASKINKVTANFFGKLVGNTTAGNASKSAGSETMGSGSASGIAYGRGGGGGGGGTAVAPQAAADSAKIGIMPPYEMKNYRFVYKGEALVAPSETIGVLKRVKSVEPGVNMSDLITGLNFGLADISTFSGLTLQNITLAQKTDFGYMVNVFPDEGSVNISQNWGYWPMDKCAGDAVCFANLRVKESDIPVDSELIRIADAFLSEHNIDKSIYGSPEVGGSYDWRIMYDSSPDKANYYFPDAIDVTYPLKVDGKYIYDEWNGVKQGITVSVNIKAKKVANLYGLTTQVYDASPYAMETDTKKLLAYAEQGGSTVYYYGPEGQTVDLELGDPESVYIRYYNYKTNSNDEMLIPAYYFPIKNPPKDPNFFRKGIVVPLAKEILAERLPTDGSISPPAPVPMPLSEPSAGAGAGTEPSLPLKTDTPTSVPTQ
jgi:hypothetical protein